MSNPYRDSNVASTTVVRTFSENIDPSELVWHRDREDRVVTVMNENGTDWLVQLDNELPQPLTSIFIPKGVYHRTIKGTGDLILKIEKY